MPPERIRTDPSNEVCPDYTHERYDTYRQLLVNSGDFPEITNNDQASDHLRGTWVAENEERRARWQQQMEEDLLVEEERRQQEQQAAALVAEEARKDKEEKRNKKRENLRDFELGTPMTPRANDHIHTYAAEKMAKGEYVDLWYFTTEATQEAEGLIRMDLDSDTFGLVKETNGKLSLSTNPSSKASAQAKPDHLLSWEEVMEAKNLFLKWIADEEWPKEHQKMFSQFYVKMDMHPELRTLHGKKIFTKYHAQMRLFWYDENKRDHPFDVSIINERELDKCRRSVQETEFNTRLTE